MPNKKGTTSASRKKTIGSKPLVTKSILMGELVEKFPIAMDVLAAYGFHCVGCMFSPYESLEAGAAVHGLPLERVIKDINAAIKKKK